MFGNASVGRFVGLGAVGLGVAAAVNFVRPSIGGHDEIDTRAERYIDAYDRGDDGQVNVPQSALLSRPPTPGDETVSYVRGYENTYEMVPFYASRQLFSEAVTVPDPGQPGHATLRPGKVGPEKLAEIMRRYDTGEKRFLGLVKKPGSAGDGKLGGSELRAFNKDFGEKFFGARGNDRSLEERAGK